MMPVYATRMPGVNFTLKEPSKIAADDTLLFFLLLSFEENKVGVSCESSA